MKKRALLLLSVCIFLLESCNQMWGDEEWTVRFVNASKDTLYVCMHDNERDLQDDPHRNFRFSEILPNHEDIGGIMKFTLQKVDKWIVWIIYKETADKYTLDRAIEEGMYDSIMVYNYKKLMADRLVIRFKGREKDMSK